MTLSKELQSFIEESLVDDGFHPDVVAEIISDKVPVSEEDIAAFINETYSLTDSPGRRSFAYCLRCNPHLNGSHGRDGTEAVAKHTIQTDNENTEQTQWEGLCYECAQQLQQANSEVQPLPGNEDLDLFTDDTPTHECSDPSWEKLSLVTESDGFDWVECKTCGIQGKRYNMTSVDVVGFDKR